MSKEKQIEFERNEISDILAQNFDLNGEKRDASDFEWSAHCVQMAGYRKASDIAREIFEELLKDITHGLEIARCTRKKFLHNIEKNNIWVYHYDGEIKALEGMECLIAELKKKYTEEGK